MITVNENRYQKGGYIRNEKRQLKAVFAMFLLAGGVLAGCGQQKRKRQRRRKKQK